MNRCSFLVALLALIICSSFAADGRADQPNILIILADDLCYGDVACYNAESRVATANIDNLAEDPGETNNLYSQQPDVVAELSALLEQTKSSGRSVPRR